ncbi:DUF305 domain-containing protein [Streptomyces sp. ISL-43]|uniref:DUF305 domain-containing protein n=1 Tax=Streptomyces sp. ISL-43 TaxID=2819183 RepID=UPI001BE6CEC7|nr:DUF305 domain-containing protein [Streptomyces sp. ISL-43]MBT2451371.1 DUF305 domain-containing protein [Streptomyces sp. ISL-43]
MHKHFVRRTAVVAAAGAAALVLVACGSGDDTSAGHAGHSSTPPAASSAAPATPATPATPAQGQHNAADVAFAKGMIPHHRQAVEMAGLAPARAESAEVKKLADEIAKAQDPEIRTMSGWLTSWGEEVPAEGATDHSGHGAGVMTAEEMDKLEKSSGKAFDTAFMELMIRHHEGAVAMAKTEKAGGAFPVARTMADAITTSQTAEIARMSSLLGKN